MEQFEWTAATLERYDVNEKYILIDKIENNSWAEGYRFDVRRTLAWLWKSLSFDGTARRFRRGKRCITISDQKGFYEQRRIAIYNWLIECTSNSPTNRYYFDTIVLTDPDPDVAEGEKSLDQETQIDFLIRNGDELDPFFFDPNKMDHPAVDKMGELHLRFLTTWFIRRYNLRRAWWLTKKMLEHQRPKLALWLTPMVLLSTGLFLTWMLIFAILIFGADYFCAQSLLTSPGMGAAARELLPGTSICVLFSTSFKVALIAIYAFLMVAFLLFCLHAQLLQLLIPRLAACIMVGYFPLIVTDEIWLAVPQLVLYTSWWPPPFSFVIGTLALFVSWVYLLIEVSNKVSNRALAWRRTSVVFLIGLGWSLIIGLLVLDLVGLAFKNRLESLHSLLWVPGLFGQIPVQVLLLYMPLALLLGIFLQIIWEEKPITEPL